MSNSGSFAVLFVMMCCLLSND